MNEHMTWEIAFFVGWWCWSFLMCVKGEVVGGGSDLKGRHNHASIRTQNKRLCEKLCGTFNPHYSEFRMNECGFKSHNLNAYAQR